MFCTPIWSRYNWKSRDMVLAGRSIKILEIVDYRHDSVYRNWRITDWAQTQTCDNFKGLFAPFHSSAANVNSVEFSGPTKLVFRMYAIQFSLIIFKAINGEYYTKLFLNSVNEDLDKRRLHLAENKILSQHVRVRTCVRWRNLMNWFSPYFTLIPVLNEMVQRKQILHKRWIYRLSWEPRQILYRICQKKKQNIWMKCMEIEI